MVGGEWNVVVKRWREGKSRVGLFPFFLSLWPSRQRQTKNILPRALFPLSPSAHNRKQKQTKLSKGSQLSPHGSRRRKSEQTCCLPFHSTLFPSPPPSLDRLHLFLPPWCHRWDEVAAGPDPAPPPAVETSSSGGKKLRDPSGIRMSCCGVCCCCCCCCCLSSCICSEKGTVIGVTTDSCWRRPEEATSSMRDDATLYSPFWGCWTEEEGGGGGGPLSSTSPSMSSTPKHISAEERA